MPSKLFRVSFIFILYNIIIIWGNGSFVGPERPISWIYFGPAPNFRPKMESRDAPIGPGPISSSMSFAVQPISISIIRWISFIGLRVMDYI